MRRVMTDGDSWFSRISHREGLPARYRQNILFCQFIISYTPSLYPHYIYPHYPHIEKSTFQRENLSHYPWEWEIVIILYTIHCGFLQLLPLHIQILERLIAQTLTTPILSGKWDFGAARKHWKKPFGGCNRAELRVSESLRRQGFVKSIGSRSLEGSST